ncbi:PAS domain-containing protein [Bacterioplanoides pacificum]|uniref:PAS domain-containing protein n=1 Tax=Bacterioplanoides pacificum TaxID=1171596 RepID=A0ABV7VWH8_9GAMM
MQLATAISQPAAGEEIKIGCNDLIVSKTNRDSHITYANDLFCRYSGYSETELLGQPHNIIRHPDMPRAVYYLMWEHLKQGEEFFGYIKNRCKQGGYYWTFASVAPIYEHDELRGYLSSRRCPSPQAVALIEPLYQRMTEAEQAVPPEQQIPMSSALLWQAINKEFTTYAEFALSL